jgi:hypothetical protein
MTAIYQFFTLVSENKSLKERKYTCNYCKANNTLTKEVIHEFTVINGNIILF